jgi:hypothetical protein
MLIAQHLAHLICARHPPGTRANDDYVCHRANFLLRDGLTGRSPCPALGATSRAVFEPRDLYRETSMGSATEIEDCQSVRARILQCYLRILIRVNLHSGSVLEGRRFVDLAVLTTPGTALA